MNRVLNSCTRHPSRGPEYSTHHQTRPAAIEIEPALDRTDSIPCNRFLFSSALGIPIPDRRRSIESPSTVSRSISASSLKFLTSQDRRAAHLSYFAGRSSIHIRERLHSSAGRIGVEEVSILVQPLAIASRLDSSTYKGRAGFSISLAFWLTNQIPAHI